MYERKRKFECVDTTLSSFGDLENSVEASPETFEIARQHAFASDHDATQTESTPAVIESGDKYVEDSKLL